MKMLFQHKGGRTRPPLCLPTPTIYDTDSSVSIRRALLALVLSTAMISAASISVIGQGNNGGRPNKRLRAIVIQRRAMIAQQRAAIIQRRIMVPASSNVRVSVPYSSTPALRPQMGGMRRQGLGPQEKAALELLRKMIRPDSDYYGVQVTELTVRGRTEQTEQKIWGDTRGWVRRDYMRPPELQNDTMLTGPNRYQYYHARRNVQDIALWPTEWNEKEKRFLNEIRSGRIAVAFAGNETLTGININAVKIRVVPQSGSNEGTVQFWIDPNTGIQLKTAKYDPAGNILSQSYLTSLTIAPVSPNNFKIAWPNANMNTLFPLQQFKTLQDAQQFLPFQPLEPTPLPSGFQTRGVWVFAPKAVLLRYTDGLTTFSLYEHVMAPAINPNAYLVPPGMYRRNVQRWRMKLATGDIEIDYIGHLPPAEAQAVHDSLR